MVLVVHGPLLELTWPRDAEVLKAHVPCLWLKRLSRAQTQTQTKLALPRELSLGVILMGFVLPKSALIKTWCIEWVYALAHAAALMCTARCCVCKPLHWSL